MADILEHADWYAAQSGQRLARRWEKANTSALLRIVRNPSAGTPCRFRQEDLRDVRWVVIPGFSKHLLFYRFRGAEILVLRVLHGARDLESLL
ncbi:MAG: type II toxin-antitoxin system RelE/ParE family toxin [Acidobacteriia bacterium]|nr:type II toxin-antitoxin system RelE/ParE family toxin [Terriglobia bacterium]